MARNTSDNDEPRVWALRDRTVVAPQAPLARNMRRVPTQAEQMAGMVKWLVSSGVKPGSVKGSMYTTLIPITKDNAASETACWNLSDLKK